MIKLPRSIRSLQQPALPNPHHPSPHPPWPTWTGINSDRRVSTQEDLGKNVRRYGEHGLLGTRPRCAWLRVTGHKFSTLRPRHHLHPTKPCPTVTRLTMKGKRHYPTGMNAKSCWILTEASSTTHQVRHHPLPPPQSNAFRTRRNAHIKSLLFKGESDAVKEEMKTKLNELIVSVFRKRPTLSYYQVPVLPF